MRPAPKILITLGLILGLAPLAVAIVHDRPDDRLDAPATSEGNPLPPEIDRTQELRACRDRGAAALDHPPCLRLWEEQRERFLGLKEPENRRDPASPLPSIDLPDDQTPPPGQD